MTHRGLYFCADDSICTLVPEHWREIDGVMIGLCEKHAIQHKWIERAPELEQTPRARKDFMTRLIDAMKDGGFDDVIDEAFPYLARKSFPTSEPVPHWSEYREDPF